MSIKDSSNQYASLLSNCIKSKNLNLGRALHSHLIKTALILDAFCTNRLIHIYSKCGSIDSAQKAFDDLPFKNVRSWNTMISACSQMGWFMKAHHMLDEMPEPNLVTFNSIVSGYVKSGLYKDAIKAYRGMQKHHRNTLLMDEFTAVAVANASAKLAAAEMLRQVHGVATVMGFVFDAVVCNALIDAYGKCGDPDSCYSIFSQMEAKDVVSWTSVVVAYTKASRLEDACRIFDRMPVRNEVSWTALITGMAQHGEGEGALSLFKAMLNEGLVANDVTYVGVLSSCADLALIGKGKQIHCRALRVRSSSIFDNVFVVNTLIDMYSKCGDMTSATKLFKRLDIKDTVTWNSIITGLAQSGHGEASLAVFHKMLKARETPNDVTFIGVLSACSHSGLESEGLKFFNMMQEKFGLVPKTDHYVILIDMLGRKNRLIEAMEMIEKAPKGYDHIGMWGALLAACRVHGNLELGTRAAMALFDLEPKNTGRYVMLANVYAAAGKLGDAHRIRMLIDSKNLKKDAGHSWIEVKNTRYVFVAEELVGSELDDMQELLITIRNHMKDF
ncbi:pentatricopeptide repeat-containing protein At2g21090-like [Andrographis paniculata]|uniref:pentatricopeptide repeat-containing protein At2g21090-like n=1 Tax=Andrographis paniculata TaxID=175694 RepID=UPI0021E7943A|nr:pentatricopeptide repeat-containing protein At2g21090-like [Andrographis paniculata]